MTHTLGGVAEKALGGILGGLLQNIFCIVTAHFIQTVCTVYRGI